MKKSELISYAASFAAFLLRNEEIANTISRIILFGSSIRGDFDKESDIDMFIETGISEKKIQKQLDLFTKSRVHEMYSLAGIQNEIVLKVGRLEKWAGLHESIVEDGVLLYGKYEESPQKLLHYTLFKISSGKKKISVKVKIWRKIYGYTQRVGKKVYASKGILEEWGCRRLAKGIFLAPFHNRQRIVDFLDRNKISYEMVDVYRKAE